MILFENMHNRSQRKKKSFLSFKNVIPRKM